MVARWWGRGRRFRSMGVAVLFRDGGQTSSQLWLSWLRGEDHGLLWLLLVGWLGIGRFGGCVPVGLEGGEFWVNWERRLGLSISMLRSYWFRVVASSAMLWDSWVGSSGGHWLRSVLSWARAWREWQPWVFVGGWGYYRGYPWRRRRQ